MSGTSTPHPRRRLVGLGLAAVAAVAATSVTALVVPGIAAAHDDVAFAPADQAVITPGVELTTMLPGGGMSSCTSNFLYSDGGQGHDDHGDDASGPEGDLDGVYIGSAAHCYAGDGGMGIDGCTPELMPLGSPVTIVGNDGSEYVGTLAYSSFEAMQRKGETDESLCMFNDFALIKLAPADVALANPSVPNFGGPTALNTDGTSQGDRVFSYQPNQITEMPNKQGLSLGQPDPFTHRVITTPPGVSGDSGSGFLDADGDAFGVLSTGTPEDMAPVINGITDLALSLDYAEANGNLGTVSLVPGDQPFSVDGLTMTQLPDAPPLP